MPVVNKDKVGFVNQNFEFLVLGVPVGDSVGDVIRTHAVLVVLFSN